MVTVDFINVGNGDSALVRWIEGDSSFTMLIDIGPSHVDYSTDSKQQLAADYLENEGIKKLDLLIISHLHPDHFGGLKELSKRVEIPWIIVGYLPRFINNPESNISSFMAIKGNKLHSEIKQYIDAISALKECGSRIDAMDFNRFDIGLTENVSMDIMYADIDSLRRQNEFLDNMIEGENISDESVLMISKDRNYTSMVVRINYSGNIMLFTGDLYTEYLEKMNIGHCDVVKLPHHGSEKSATKRLLDLLTPRVVVVSCSASEGEKFRPTPDLVKLLIRNVPQVFLTENPGMTGLPAYSNKSIRLEMFGCGLINTKYIN